MKTVSDEDQQRADRDRRRIFWLCIPTFVTLSVELLGVWRFGKDTYSERYAIHLGPFYPLVWVALALVIVAPLLVAQGFITLFSKWSALRAERRCCLPCFSCLRCLFS